MTSFPQPCSIEDYFRLEETAVEKHEYSNGKIVCMPGGTSDHSAIIVNAIFALKLALKGSPCRPYEGNLRLGSTTKSKFVYPDIQVVCGPIQFDSRDKGRGTILNPTVVIEVLSTSTEAHDRGRKFDFYRDVESMQEYILISQREPLVETFLRKGEGEWAFAPARGLDAVLKLPSLNLTIPFSDIFDGVDFPPPELDE